MYHIKPNLTKRVLASLFDYLIFFGFFYFYIAAYGHVTAPGRKEVTGVEILPILFFRLIYFIGIESLFGSTHGHYAFHLKVLTKGRRNTNVIASSARHLLDIFDFFFLGIPAIISISKTDSHQRLGDILAGTIVVDTNDPEQYSINKTK